MRGTDKKTGKELSGIEHVRQSVEDILTTPIGTRVMRRDYGSRLFELVDAPMNSATLMQIYSATAEALGKWEPRLRVKKISATQASPGRIVLTVLGHYVPEGRDINLENLEVRA